MAKLPTGSHARCDIEIKRLRAENARLRAIVDKLPKTADGVLVVPGMDAVYLSAGVPGALPVDGTVVEVGWDIAAKGFIVRLQESHGEGWWADLPDELYSTREAAEAAGGEDGTK